MRTFSVFVLIPIVTVCYSVAVMIHMGMFRDPAVFYVYARSWSRLLLRLAGVTVTVQGVSKLQGLAAGVPRIYAANHASLFDIPVLLGYLPDNVRIMYKRELERIPVFGWCLRMSPFIAVNRTNAREANAAIEQTAASIQRGPSVLVFPEGTRSTSGELGTFKRGVLSLAAKASTPIQLVALVGTNRIMPAKTFRVRGGQVTLNILHSVDAPVSLTRDEERALLERMHDAIAAGLDL